MLSFYLDKSHPTYTVVQKFIKQLARKIPRYRANNRTDNDVPTLCSHLTREFLTVCNEDFLMIDYKVNHPIRFFQHRLEAVSLYRYVEEYLRYPTGLAVEYLLYSKRLKCPLSGKCLDLNGGCEAAWADLICEASKVNVEVKTKRRFRYPNIRGGSYRWYKAQEKAGMKNYLVIVPREGGTIIRYKILNVKYNIDDKFCAYYNSPYRDRARLRSYVRLGEGVAVGATTRKELDSLEKEAKDIVDRLMKIRFGHYARVVQRCFRRNRFLRGISV